jgi:hypothetical protein
MNDRLPGTLLAALIVAQKVDGTQSNKDKPTPVVAGGVSKHRPPERSRAAVEEVAGGKSASSTAQ